MPEQGGSPNFFFLSGDIDGASILSVCKLIAVLGGICVWGLVSLLTVANRVFASLVLVLMILKKNVSQALFKSKL